MNCAPVCQINYDTIVRLEDMDENELIEQLGLSKRLKARRRRVNANDRSSSGNITEEEQTRVYFSLLDKSDVIGLYEIYMRDFQMFGYSFQFGAKTALPERDSGFPTC